MCNFNSYNRIVIKIGSAVLADSKGKIDHIFLTRLAEDVAWLKKKNKDVLIVSSGAIAVGRKNIALSKDLTLAESQALAAHGQIELMIAWKKHMNKYGIHIGQMLLTPRETELKVSAKNAQQTIAKLLEVECLPIINENDSTATDEIKFGDNDLLAAKISTLFQADLLKKSEQLPTDQEQYMLIEDLYKTTEKLEITQEQNMTNKVNIEFLKAQLEKALNDVEQLKDKVRANGNGTH